ncbi:hypothetical protein JL721_10920 [Aureococcus anophagefferens]|nr:hypothetical protein JL721_10920 [Aureococcus anophagefferens]
MLSTTTALPTETSWGDTLKSYQAERGLASWDKLGEAHPPKDHRPRPTARSSPRAVDKQPPFDIVTHEFRSGKTPADRAPSNKPPDSRTSWNIINHEAKDPRAPPRKSVVDARAESGLLPASWKRREFDIVSNKYISDHKGRTLRDRTEAKHSAQKLFWETHDFDPLLGRYYDAGKEADFAKQRAVLSSIAGQGSVARLPPAVQYCEGAAYDIVSHAVKDQAKLEVASGVGNRAIASKKGPSVEAELRDRSVKRDDRDKSRALARFAKTVDFCEREGGHHGYGVPAPPTAPASSRTGNVPMRSKPSGRGVPAPTGAAAPAGPPCPAQAPDEPSLRGASLRTMLPS